MKTIFRKISSKWLKIFILFPLIISNHGHAQTTFQFKSNYPVLQPVLNSTLSSANTPQTISSSREAQCLRTGRWLGAIAGSTMGVLQIYWKATGVSGVHGPMWKNLVTAIPSSLIGAYVGTRSTGWTTKMIIRGQPKPVLAALKGAMYGALDGTIILTASLVPLLIIGHYMETIHFNMSHDWIVLKLIGASIAGGFVYGGTFGAIIGLAYGPCVSIYMQF